MRARLTVHALCVAVAACAAALPPRLWAAEEPVPKPFRYDPKNHRDPFAALVREGRLVASGQTSRAEMSKPMLYGILWDPGGNSIAVVNDKEVRVGDMIGDYQVSEIRPDAVVLESGGEPVVLELPFEMPPSKLSPRTIPGGERP